MALNPNPQDGYDPSRTAELNQVAQTTFDFDGAADNNAVISDSDSAITVTSFDDRPLYLTIRRSGGSTGRAIQASGIVDLSEIGDGAHNTGDALNADDDTIPMVGEVTWFISRGSGGHVILASSDVSVSPGNASGDEVTLTLYEIR